MLQRYNDALTRKTVAYREFPGMHFAYAIGTAWLKIYLWVYAKCTCSDRSACMRSRIRTTPVCSSNNRTMLATFKSELRMLCSMRACRSTCSWRIFQSNGKNNHQEPTESPKTPNGKEKKKKRKQLKRRNKTSKKPSEKPSSYPADTHNATLDNARKLKD